MKREIGTTGISVNAIGLGAMALSIQGRPTEQQALAVIAAFVEGGGDLIDTAISYCIDDADFGHNERLIAKALAALGRTDVVVATKGGLTRPGGRWDVDASPQWLRECCERSARALGEPLDLYYLHAVDPTVPFLESLGELVRLRDEGKIGAIGLSNVDAGQLEDALRVTPIAAVQNRCNFYERRDFDNGLVALCARRGVAYVPYSPVGGHFGHRRVGSDATLATIAEKHAASPYAVALAWLLRQGEHVLPIPGASKVASVESSLGATALTLDDDDLRFLDGATGR
jgi:aryl-alcohol dehydrogenase-like predicted oxidoreductase